VSFGFTEGYKKAEREEAEQGRLLSDDVDHKIDAAGIESPEYDTRWGRCRLSLHKEDITRNQQLLKELMTAAYQSRSA